MLLFLLAFAHAADRVEIPISRKDSAQVVSAGDRGAVVYVTRGNAKKSYEIHGYGPDLEATWTQSHTVGKRMLQTAFANQGAYTWMLLQRDVKSVDVVRTHVATGDTEQFHIKMAKKYIGRGKIAPDAIGGAWVSTSGRKHSNLVYISQDGVVGKVEALKKTHIVDLTANDAGVQAASMPLWNNKTTPLTLRTMQQGATTAERLVQPDGDTIMLTGRALQIAGNDWIVGTYQPAKALFPGAQGMYVATFDAQSQTSYSVHAFGDFDGFLEFLPDRRQDRLEGRVDKKKSKGKTPKVRMNLLFSDAITTSEGGIVVAEAYHPVYRTYTTTSTDAQGNTVYTTHTVFVGFQFTHAMIAAFSATGERLWDHSVPLDRRLTGVVTAHVRLSQSEDGLSVIYPYDRLLHRAEFRGGQWIGEAHSISMAEVGGDEDEDKNLYGDVTWWHSDQFMAWGIDKERGLGNKKRVFWISALDPSN